jgi:integrase
MNFLDEGDVYESLNIYQKHKADWLLEKDKYSDVTKRNYYISLDSKVNYAEVAKGKDLYDWNKEEIIKLVKNMATKSRSSKISLFSIISMYINWAVERGFNYVGNPCDTIDTKDLFTPSELALKESYQDLQEFYDFIFDLQHCSDVDRAIMTLLRYGVKIEHIGKIRWEDVDRENKMLYIYDEERQEKILQLPIDNLFIIVMEKAKACEKRQFQGSDLFYDDRGYIIKTTERYSWETIDKRNVYNRLGEITRKNKINRISVPDLRLARRYDLLYSILDETGEVTTGDVIDVINIVDGKPTEAKLITLRNTFELISGVSVVKYVAYKRKNEYKKEKEKAEESTETSTTEG